MSDLVKTLALYGNDVPIGGTINTLLLGAFGWLSGGPPSFSPYIIDAASAHPTSPYNTLDTAAHNFHQLMTDIVLQNNDIIKIVDGTEVNDAANDIVIIGINLTIEPYYGINRKPTVRLKPLSNGFSYDGTGIYNLNMWGILFR